MHQLRFRHSDQQFFWNLQHSNIYRDHWKLCQHTSAPTCKIKSFQHNYIHLQLSINPIPYIKQTCIPISYRYCKSHKYAVSGKHLKCKFSYDSKYVSKQLMQVGKLAWHSLYAMQELRSRFPGSLYEHFLYTLRGVIQSQFSALTSLAETTSHIIRFTSETLDCKPG